MRTGCGRVGLIAHRGRGVPRPEVGIVVYDASRGGGGCSQSCECFGRYWRPSSARQPRCLITSAGAETDDDHGDHHEGDEAAANQVQAASARARGGQSFFSGDPFGASAFLLFLAASHDGRKLLQPVKRLLRSYVFAFDWADLSRRRRVAWFLLRWMAANQARPATQSSVATKKFSRSPRMCSE